MSLSSDLTVLKQETPSPFNGEQVKKDVVSVSHQSISKVSISKNKIKIVFINKFFVKQKIKIKHDLQLSCFSLNSGAFG